MDRNNPNPPTENGTSSPSAHGAIDSTYIPANNEGDTTIGDNSDMPGTDTFVARLDDTDAVSKTWDDVAGPFMPNTEDIVDIQLWREGAVFAVAVSDPPHHLVLFAALVSGERFAVRLWNLMTGHETRTLRTRPNWGPVRQVAFTASSTHVVVACANTIAVLGIEGTKAPVVAMTYKSPVSAFSISVDKDTRKLVTVCYDKSVYAHAFGPGGIVGYAQELQQTDPTGKSPDNFQTDVTSTRSSAVQDSSQTKTVAVDAFAHAVQFSPDSRYIVLGLTNGHIRVFTSGTHKEVGKYTPHRLPIFAVAVDWAGPERQMMIATGGGDHCVRVHALLTSELHFELDGHTRAVACLAFTADGVFLASGGHDAVISLWSMHTGNQVWLFRGHTGPVRTLAFVNEIEQDLVSGGDDRSIRLWSVKTGLEKSVL